MTKWKFDGKKEIKKGGWKLEDKKWGKEKN